MEKAQARAPISIDDVPLSVKHDIIDMLLSNCPPFEKYWMEEQGVMTFVESYVSQFIFGTENLENSSSEGYGDEQPFFITPITIDPAEIDNSKRSVSDNVVGQYAALKTEAPPILIRRVNRKWKIIEGGHRLAAAKAQGATLIRAYDVSVFFYADYYNL